MSDPVEFTVDRVAVRSGTPQERDTARRVLADLIVAAITHNLRVEQIPQPSGDVLVRITGSFGDLSAASPRLAEITKQLPGAPHAQTHA